MALGEDRLRSIVESLLLISPDPIPVARMVEVIRIEDPTTEEEAIRDAIKALLSGYAQPDRPLARGYRVEDVSGGLQLRTVAENGPYVRRFLAARPQKLSRAALETLAIIAYRQPVTKPEVEAIRGVDAGAGLRTLLERDLVKIVGKRDEVGRPLIYGTTDAFLELFTLKSLSELPTLREFHELDELSLEEVGASDGGPSVAELAGTAKQLVERQDEAELDALDEAVRAADAAKAAAEAALDQHRAGGAPPKPGAEPEASVPAESGPPESEATANLEAEPASDEQSGGAPEASAEPEGEATSDLESELARAGRATDEEGGGDPEASAEPPEGEATSDLEAEPDQEQEVTSSLEDEVTSSLEAEPDEEQEATSSLERDVDDVTSDVGSDDESASD